MNFSQAVIALAVLGTLSNASYPATQADADRLGNDLTPVGAEKSASKDNAIPAFTGPSKPTGDWSYGKVREDFWKYKDEKATFIIDASNVDKYANNLSAGQIALIKQVKGYTMPVYPTHRECSVPDFVAQNTKDGILKSSIAKDGWSLENATLPGVPFPVPTTGIQVMWNWMMRYQGVGVEWPDGYTYVSPRPGAAPIIVRWNQQTYYPWAKKGQHTPEDEQGLHTGIFYGYSEPAALAGQGIVQRYYYKKDTDSFYYFTGQRRVRRLPAYAYDAPAIGYDNQYPYDMNYVFTGNPDRFDWKLVGKKEIYIPYNELAMQRFNSKLSDATQPDLVNPALRRYELHRVWEIQGTVKAGFRHTTPTKTLYVDEDSWLVAIGDDFDAQGKIWKVKENYIAPEWEIGACSLAGASYTDLISGRYIFDMIVIGTGKDLKFYSPGATEPRFTSSYYTGENLSAISSR